MRYLQLYAIDKDAPTFYKDWSKHLDNEPGYRVLMSSTPYQYIKMLGGHMAWDAGLPTVKLDTGNHDEIVDTDLVHVHLTGENINLIERLKKKTKATVIASIDYGMRLWGQAIGFHSLEMMAGALSKADFVFVQEREIAHLLTEFMGRDVPFLPHPVNIKATGKYKVDEWDEPKTCAVMVHRYDNDWYLPHLVLHDLIKTHVIGLDEKTQNACNGVLYNKVTKYTSFEYMLDPDVKNLQSAYLGGFLPGAYVSFDSYGLRVAGRWQCDMASLGIPCIGSDLHFFQRQCFPETTAGFYEITQQRAIAKRLLEDNDFYNEVSENCQIRIKPFGFEPTKKRFMNFLEGKDFEDFKKIGLIDAYREEEVDDREI